MKHEVDIALALSTQGEICFQYKAAAHPELTQFIAQAYTHTNDGSILRYWECVEVSKEFSQFIDDLTSSIKKTDYRMVFVSHYSDGWEKGEIINPFSLHLHVYTGYEVEFIEC